MSAFPDPPRYCPERELPETAFVPRRSARPTASLCVDDDSGGNLRFAVDLFNHGYYWEAHEVWESEWNRAGRQGLWATCLKGLIKLAAAGVKFREKNPEGFRRHCLRALELLQPARHAWNPVEHGICPWDWDELLELATPPFEGLLSADDEGSLPHRVWTRTLRWGVFSTN